MKHYIALALCVLLALGTAASVSAGASFFGPSGYISMPTTDALSMGQVQAFANYISTDDANQAPVGVNVGLGMGFELGVTQIHQSGSPDSNNAIINAKYVVSGGNLVMPQIAVGATNIANNDNFLGSLIKHSITGETNPYVVMGKSLTLPGGAGVSVNAGYMAGNVNKGMFGASLSLSPKIEFMADYIGDVSKLSVGLRYQTNSGLGIQAASIDGEIAAGVMYTRALFGK